MTDEEARTDEALLDALHGGWDILFLNAIWDAAIEADHPSGKGPRDVEDWAERAAEKGIEYYQEKIEDEEDVNPPELAELNQAESIYYRVLLAAWREVRKDYHSRHTEVRSLGEIAEAVAQSFGFTLPDDFSMESLDRDRFNVIYP